MGGWGGGGGPEQCGPPPHILPPTSTYPPHSCAAHTAPHTPAPTHHLTHPAHTPAHTCRFEDADFLGELKKPEAERTPPCVPLLRGEAVEVWKRYAELPDNTHY